jgi:hypothetical protein
MSIIAFTRNRTRLTVTIRFYGDIHSFMVASSRQIGSCREAKFRLSTGGAEERG